MNKPASNLWQEINTGHGYAV